MASSAVAPPSPVAAAKDGALIEVRLAPRAASERILGLVAEGEGRVALKIAVTAPPEDGRANAALLRLLSRTLRLPLGDFALRRGAASRHKLISVSGEPGLLVRRIEEGLSPWLIPS
jgi:uncharacterized protein